MTWHLWAISVDRRVRGSDTYTNRVIGALKESRTKPVLLADALYMNKDGPVVPLLGSLLVRLAGPPPASLRLLSALAHAVMIIQCFALGRRLWGRENAGLYAALLYATCPVVFGVCRLTFHDPVAGVALLGAIHLMLRVDLTRLRPALGLGAVLGLGGLVKLSFAWNMIWPGIWFLLRRVRIRDRRGIVYLSAMLGTTCVLFLPWFLWQWPIIFRGSIMVNVRALAIPLVEKLHFYADLPGLLPLVALGIASGVALWRSQRVDRWELALLLTAFPMLAAVLFSPHWGRFVVPILPLLAVVGGAGLALAQERLPSPWGGVLAWSLTGALLLLFVGINTSAVVIEHPDIIREEREGMVRPDRRPYLGFYRAITSLKPGRRAVLLAADSLVARRQTHLEWYLWRYNGLRYKILDLSAARNRLRAGKPVSVLLIRYFPLRPLAGPSKDLDAPLATLPDAAALWLVRQPGRRTLSITRDPDGVTYVLFRIEPEQDA